MAVVSAMAGRLWMPVVLGVFAIYCFWKSIQAPGTDY